MSMQGPLAALLQQGQGGGAQPPLSPPNPPSLGIGPPPNLPGGLPPPTGVGAMPTGNAGMDKKAAIDQAILSLREVSGHVPNMGPQLSSLIDQLVSAGKAASAEPKPGVGSPDGSSQDAASASLGSGSAGPM